MKTRRRSTESDPTRMLAGVLVLVTIVIVTALITGVWWFA
jgi:hypothetical protein